MDTATLTPRQQAAREMAQMANVQVGDIFASSWGYEQTNVDYYEVVRVSATGMSVGVVRINHEVIDGHGGPSETVRPLPGTGDRDSVETYRIRAYHNPRFDTVSVSFRWSSFGSASRCSGDMTRTQTGYAYGH